MVDSDIIAAVCANTASYLLEAFVPVIVAVDSPLRLLPSVSLFTKGDGSSPPSVIRMTVDGGGDGGWDCGCCFFLPPPPAAAAPISFNKNSNSFVYMVDANISYGPVKDAYPRLRYFNNGSSRVIGSLWLVYIPYLVRQQQ